MSATAITMMEVVPESQRLIAVSLGKIAASRGQKGGINLHKNLLVATVLHKARTVYMMQHYNRQRAAAAAAVNGTATAAAGSVPGVTQPSQPVATATATDPASPSTPTAAVLTTSAPQNIEMRDDASSSSASNTAAENSTSRAAPLTGPHHADAPSSATLSTATAQTAFPVGAQVSSVHMSEDKENTPPSPKHSSPTVESAVVGVVVPSPVSPECEARLHDGDPRKSDPSSASVTHGRNNGVARGVNGKVTSSCISCVLKRRRLTDNENVSAPKVRILEVKVALENAANSGGVTEPMQCDSPQISSLVNIFNISFANGLAGNGTLALGQAGSDHSVRSLVKLSENLTCAKEISLGASMDSSLRQPLVLSV